MRSKMVKGLLIVLLLVILIGIFFRYVKTDIDPQLTSNLEGTIYFTERVNGVLTLYRSDATLENKVLIYSHKGKGKDSYGGSNHNIIDFHYDKTNKTIDFIAMDSGTWSLFSIKEGDNKPSLIRKGVMEIKTDYINNQFEDTMAFSRKGSLYLLENGNEKLIKRFRGIYEQKWTGYRPIGFSPDGKYLVYHSMEQLTPIGTILNGLIKDQVGQVYIMDLATLKSTKFVNSFYIQWVID